MKDLNTYKNIYFLGIGGIGMSALARYFKLKSFNVVGYDKTTSVLTDELQKEGIAIHFDDKGQGVESIFTKENTLVIYTPAVPKDLGELNYFIKNEFTLLKRAAILGLITNATKGIGVAGTHGKTTTSTLLTHILMQSELKCSAFLGGISTNLNSNFTFDENSPYTIIEADEFDRSFLQLNPFASIITSTDADHLDIYGDDSHFLEGFQMYADKVDADGLIVMKKGLNLNSKTKILTYAIDEEADFTASNLRIQNGDFLMDVEASTLSWKDVELGLPGIHNAENALSCIAMANFLNIPEDTIRLALQTFKGVKRRFEYHIKSKELVYLDDYAHHPTEIRSLVNSLKMLYPNQKITGIFQPHLFSRTRDFIDDFAHELSQLDELILMPIYPARELPIEGITSEFLLSKCTNKHKKVFDATQVMDYVSGIKDGIIATIGAGDIDRIVPKIKVELTKNRKV